MRILIAGAGPSGAYLANLLAKKGLNISLVDKLKSPLNNPYSSAVLPLKSISQFSIPSKVISSYWNSWRIFSPSSNIYKWENSDSIGVVLDFGKFRQYLWELASNSGVKILSGCKVAKVISYSNYATVKLISKEGRSFVEQFDFVIDATGSKRELLGPLNNDQIGSFDKVLTGYGIEWIAKVDSITYNFWKDNLTFFLGCKWIKYGYGWIFPNGDNCLKIGVCSLEKMFTNKINMNRDIKNLLKKNNLSDFSVVERHGGELKSSIFRSESNIKQRVIGVGDAISTANFLGGEGIRHSLLSAKILSEEIFNIYDQVSYINSSDLINIGRKFQKRLRRELSWRWPISNLIAYKVWKKISTKEGDDYIEEVISELSNKASPLDLSMILFDYNFSRYGLRLLPYVFKSRKICL